MNLNPFQSEVEPISVEGFQVVSGELFSHIKSYASPSCTIWGSGITFNRLALTALNCCERIRLEVHPQKKSLLAVPVTAKDKDSIIWRKNIKEYAPRRMESVRFSSQIYEIWGWDTSWVYRAVGHVVTVENKIMLLFDFSAPEQWKAKEKKTAK